MKNSSGYRALITVLVLLPVSLGFIVFYVWGPSTDDTDYEGQLVVYSYSSFMGAWGPGPELARRFQEREGVPVKFVDSGDSALIVERLRFQSPAERVDVVLGLDQLILPEARSVLKWRPLEHASIQWHDKLPRTYVFDEFIPLNWAPMTFLHRVYPGEEGAVLKLDDLLGEKYRDEIVLLDPRMSTPGFQLLYWILTEKGEEEGFRYLENLSDSVHSVHSSWSTGYNLFKRESADLIFSYMTSVLYHWIEEGDRTYQPMKFSERMPFQVEYVAIPEKCKKCDWAEKFVDFLLEPESQKIIMEKNYMLPALAGVQELNPLFHLPEYELMDEALSMDILRRKRELLERWKKLGL